MERRARARELRRARERGSADLVPDADRDPARRDDGPAAEERSPSSMAAASASSPPPSEFARAHVPSPAPDARDVQAADARASSSSEHDRPRIDALGSGVPVAESSGADVSAAPAADARSLAAPALPTLAPERVASADVAPAPSAAPMFVAPRSAALVVENLSKDYEGARAVTDLSCRVDAGEILGLVGPNGAGKTTTLRSIAGVLPLQTGRVMIAGEDLAHAEVKAKQNLAWIPDDPQPFDSLTVHEHLRFTAALYGVREWEERAERLLERFELTHKRDALGGELSRGMRQKLAFCCAWVHRPKVVLMDEPLSGLDPRGIRSAKLAIQELAHDGTAVILSSHLLELIEELAHRILIVDHGRKVFAGTLSEARTSLRASEGSSLEEIFLAVTEAPSNAAERASETAHE